MRCAKKNEIDDVTAIQNTFGIGGGRYVNDRVRDQYGFFIYHGFDVMKQGNQDSESFSQLDVIRSIRSGYDTSVIIPTAGGKSLCFQAAAILMPGITIVVSPLVALIDDQIKTFNGRMKSLKEPYRAIGMGGVLTGQSGLEMLTGRSEKDKYGQEIRYKLLYLSPEHLLHPVAGRLLVDYENRGSLQITQVVIDEAHCYSQWGYSFREKYLSIPVFIRELKKRPVISSFSATASVFDETLLERTIPFRISKMKRFCCLEERKGLTIIKKAIRGENAKEEAELRKGATLDILKAYYRDARDDEVKMKSKYAVVYCKRIDQVGDLYHYLRDHCRQIFLHDYQIGQYYADMKRSEKRDAIEGDTRLLIATVAFGMGIDKEIGLIIHYDIPETIEEYVQEIGRAARTADTTAECYLIYAENDQRNKLGMVTEANRDRIAELHQIVSAGKNRLLPGLSQRSMDYLREVLYFRRCRAMELFRRMPSMNEATDDDGFNLFDFIHEYWSSFNLDSERVKTGFEVFVDDVNDLISSINALQIDNTLVANILRMHPEQYVMNKWNTAEIREWRRVKERIFTKIHLDDIDKETLIYKTWRGRLTLSNKNNIIDEIDRWIAKRGMKADNALVVDPRDVVLEVFMRDNAGGWMEASDNPDYQKRRRKYVGKIVKIPIVTRMKPETPYEDEAENPPIVLVHGKRTSTVRFMIKGEKRPDYWDMCVAEAVYTIIDRRRPIIYCKEIWEVLSGNRHVKFSRAGSFIQNEIVSSLRKLMNIEVIIDDPIIMKTIHGRLLPIKERDNGKTGYTYDAIPPLQKYAEELNGEIIELPVYLLHLYGSRNDDDELKPVPLLTPNWKKHFPYEQGMKCAVGKSVPMEVSCSGEKIERELSREEMQEPSIMLESSKGIQKIGIPTYAWESSKELSVLCHYLLHRIYISNRKSRGRYINFDNLYVMMYDYLTKQEKENRLLFRSKILSVLCFYQKIGLVRFVGYISDFIFEDIDGGRSVENAYFAIKHRPSVQYWEKKGQLCVATRLFSFAWVVESYENRNYMNDAEKSRVTVVQRDGSSIDVMVTERYTEQTITEIRTVSELNLTGVKLLYTRN